jgi:hypothetical protein
VKVFLDYDLPHSMWLRCSYEYTFGPHSILYNPPVAEDRGKEEEKFDFTAEGEGYIGLADARMLAVRTAAESPGDYGRNFREVAMVFEVVESGVISRQHCRLKRHIDQ